MDSLTTDQNTYHTVEPDISHLANTVMAYSTVEPLTPRCGQNLRAGVSVLRRSVSENGVWHGSCYVSHTCCHLLPVKGSTERDVAVGLGGV